MSNEATDRNQPTGQPVFLNYGMGVDSTAILLRWLADPSSRDFALEDLVVVTSQTGDEFAETGELVETHILPRLKAAGVRFVEIARKSKSTKKGELFVVLQDGRAPGRLHLEGVFKLSDEMGQAGTIPQSGGGHVCSIKSKANPIDAWIDEDLEATTERARVFGYAKGEERRVEKLEAFGYAKGEETRAAKAVLYKGVESVRFPLLDWAWDRQACVDYIRTQTGVEWPKSACTYCPFAFGKDKAESLARLGRQPLEAVKGLLLETTARALNPNAGKLYKTRALRDVLEGNETAIKAFELSLKSSTWALYRVRRQWRATKKAGRFNAGRCLEIVEKGSRDAMIEALEELAETKGLLVEAEGDAFRVVVQAEEKGDGAQDEAYAIAPASAQEKIGPTFKVEIWREA